VDFSWSHWRYRTTAAAALGVLAIVGLVATSASAGEQPLVTPVDVTASLTPGQADVEGIRVEISGAVASPSVVQLPEGSRVIDAIEAAGGWGERVDPLRVEVCINLAAPLQDGGAIRIPTLDDRFLLGTTGISCGSLYAPPTEIAATSGVQGSSPTSAPINLNTATAEQLDALPGIGPVTAAKIIAARKEGPFLVADDLVARGVISSRVLEQIRPLVSP
jgi:competence protein ComEA